MSTPQDKSDAEYQAKVKEASRSGRLSFRNYAEHTLRREFKDQAIEQCKSHVDAFGKCAHENGLMVVVNCRQLNKDLNACMGIHNSNEAFEKYKEKNKDVLEKKIIRG